MDQEFGWEHRDGGELVASRSNAAKEKMYANFFCIELSTRSLSIYVGRSQSWEPRIHILEGVRPVSPRKFPRDNFQVRVNMRER